MIPRVTADELVAALEKTDVDDEVWALLIEHQAGALEVHEWTGNAYAFPVRGGLEGFVREALLTDQPVECATAKRAGLDPLNDCDRCEHVTPQADPPYRLPRFA